MGDNLLLEGAAFEQFRQYCRTQGFDLSYYTSEISGSIKEIADYYSDSPKVIRLRKRRFGFSGVPYDVAEWQRESWRENFIRLRKDFLDKGKRGG
ncbi:MAG: hypothetical protein N3E40_01325 [Dehalococcoidia bacterium]|nr:hypothetical protein [Dehalococcoidia bacterium]